MAETSDQANRHFTRILLCVDGSKHSEASFKHYLNIIHKPAYEVLVVHVSDAAFVPSINLMAEGIAIHTDEIQRRIAHINQKNDDLEKLYKAKCEKAELTFRYRTIHADDSVGRAICEVVKSDNIDAVVIGSRGLGKLRRTLLGSVSDYVLHHTHVPVFICPAKVAND